MAHHIDFRVSISLIFTCVSICFGAQFVNVTIPGLGTSRGLKETVLGKSVDSFKGIPYAKPPVGPLRFMPPQNTSWTGILNSTAFGSICPQINSVSGALDKNAKEDCLTLSIYRPSVASGTIPVMFWIHGGSYITGSQNVYDGSLLASQYNVVVVTINYRLGILGYFNIPGTDTKGNYGMLDQIAALRWVKKNIGSFGGDPNKVTIFGESAGSSSVSLLTVSPLIKNEKLFTRAILESGTATCPWAAYADKSKKRAKLFGASLGCTDLKSLADCLRGKTPNEILVKQAAPAEPIDSLQAPTVDGHFLKGLPWDLQQTNKLEASPLQLLIGYNNDEGTVFAGNPATTSETTFKHSVSSWLTMRYNGTQDILHKVVAYEYTRYTQTSPFFKWFDSYADWIGDFLFVNDITNHAEYLAKKGKSVHLYQFSYLPKYLRVPYWKVSHALEVPFVFGSPLMQDQSFLQSNYTEEDKTVCRNFMEMWTNFAKNGNPGKNWPKYTESKKGYMDIGVNLTTNQVPRPRRSSFWNNLVPSLANISYQNPCKNKVGGSGARIENFVGFTSLLLLFSFILSLLA